MKIISNFKDYYDSVAWTYGGGDPKVRYERMPIKNTGPFEYRDIAAPLSVRFHRTLRDKYHECTLIVGGRVYTIFYTTSWVWGDRKYFLPDENHEIIKKGDRMLSRDWEKSGPKILYHESPHAIELCKLVGQPVFWIEQSYDEKGKHFIRVVDDHYVGADAPKRVPQLHRIKNFARFYPPDQIYQDLSYVIGNLMHTPPDDKPPVEVDEKVRFLKKGFDAKTSFRGKV